VTDPDFGHFHALLRTAIRERGLSLESIQRRLSLQGLSVGRSTLSYWQNGRRRPTTGASVAVVRALEGILRVPAESLTQALASTPAKVRAPVLQMSARGMELDHMIRSAGCEGALLSLETTAFVDLVSIGADGAIMRTMSLHTVRALAEMERYPAIFGGEPGGSAAKIRHEALSGCRIGRVVRDEESNVCVSELVLDRKLTRGETHLLQFLAHDDNHIPVNTIFKLVVTPPALLALEVSFHPDKLPVLIEEFEKATEDEPDSFVRVRTLGSDSRVALIRERARRGLVGFRWSYADSPP
jgi:transcriptional regulator with XRE-family HTH domain